MRNDLYFELRPFGEEPHDLYPGGGREIALIEFLPGVVVSFHRFNIGRVKILLDYILKSGPELLKRLLNIAIESSDLVGSDIARHRSRDIDHIAHPDCLRIAGSGILFLSEMPFLFLNLVVLGL